MKRRILFIDGPLGGGGAERVLIDILRNFDYSRYEVDLAVICRGGALMDEVPPEVNVIELWKGYTWDYKLAFRLSKWLRCNWLFSRKMNGKKLRRDYDAEISFLEGMPLKLGALRTTSSKKISWVHVDLHRFPYETSQFYSGEELEDYNRMDCIIHVSEDCKKAFLKRFPDCKAPSSIIYNPIDRKKITSSSLRPTGNDNVDSIRQQNNPETNSVVNIVTVGRLTAQKNPKLWLEVVKGIKDLGLPAKFTWIGDGELKTDLIHECHKAEVEDIVEFTGFLKNPFPLIKDADIMLMTSAFEGFGLVVCEAMCLGTPVISTATAGPSEILGNNEYGRLTDHSAESILNVLKEWIENPKLRDFYSKKALQRPDDYSIEKTLQNIYSLLAK